MTDPDLESRAQANDSSTPAPAKRGGPWFLVPLVAAVVLVLSVPALPAFGRGLAHLQTVGNKGGRWGGTVTITDCSRGALYFNWACRGDYQVNDPLAQPFPPVSNAIVANDLRFHATGAQVGAALPPNTYRAYLWGALQQLRTGAFWVGLLLCAAGGLLGLRRHRRIGLPTTSTVVGVLLLVAVHPYW